MGFKCGIVGLPNVGKSTIFNALTSAKAEAANYPFCTINPNTGIVRVPDPRLEQIRALIKTEEVIPTQMTFVDIAGLVKGASKGEGLGNQFLGHIRETQAIAHVVRCFEDGNIVHVEGSVDPIRDVQVIDLELMLADLDALQKKFSNISKAAKAGDKKSMAQHSVLDRIRVALDAGTPVRAIGLDPTELEVVKEFHFLTSKPVLYIANVNEGAGAADPAQNQLLAKVLKHAESEGAPVVAICGKVESEIAELEEADKIEFLKELGMKEPGLAAVIRSGYQLLGLQTYFTAGPKEVRAWTIPKGAKAPQAAGVIHSDFERGFIRAEIYHVEDLIKHKSEDKIRDAGLLRLEGKEYVVKDGDVIHFRFAV